MPFRSKEKKNGSGFFLKEYLLSFIFWCCCKWGFPSEVLWLELDCGLFGWLIPLCMK